jgi:hypothetical protein
LSTTTRFTRTRLSDIVHPVSSSQLTEARDRVRSFGGYNRGGYRTAAGANIRATQYRMEFLGGAVVNMRVVECGCGSCPVRDAGFTPEAYRGETYAWDHGWF